MTIPPVDDSPEPVDWHAIVRKGLDDALFGLEAMRALMHSHRLVETVNVDYILTSTQEAIAALPRSIPTPEGDGLVADDLTWDELWSRARDLVVKSGWEASSRLSLHSVMGLMVAFALETTRNPPPSCDYPTCGCDHDAVCNAALPRMGKGIAMRDDAVDIPIMKHKDLQT